MNKRRISKIHSKPTNKTIDTHIPPHTCILQQKIIPDIEITNENITSCNVDRIGFNHKAALLLVSALLLLLNSSSDIVACSLLVVVVLVLVVAIVAADGDKVVAAAIASGGIGRSKQLL